MALMKVGFDIGNGEMLLFREIRTEIRAGVKFCHIDKYLEQLQEVFQTCATNCTIQCCGWNALCFDDENISCIKDEKAAIVKVRQQIESVEEDYIDSDILSISLAKSDVVNLLLFLEKKIDEL